MNKISNHRAAKGDARPTISGYLVFQIEHNLTIFDEPIELIGAFLELAGGLGFQDLKIYIKKNKFRTLFF